MTLGTYQVGDLVRLYDLSATLAPIVYRIVAQRFNAGRMEALIIDIEAEGPEAGDSLQWVDTIRLEKIKGGNTNGTRTQTTSAATDLGGGPGLRDSGRDLPGSGPAGGAVNAPVIPSDELVRMVATVRHWQKGGGGSRGVAQVPDTDEGFAEAVAKLINFRLEWILRDAKREHELDVAKVREEVARMTAKIQERVEGLDRRLSGTQSDIGVMGIRSDLGRLAMRLDMLEEGKGKAFADLQERVEGLDRRLSDTQRDLSPLGIRMDLGRLLTRVEMLEEGKTPRANPLRPGGDPATDSQLRELDARIRNLSGRFEQLVRDADTQGLRGLVEGLAGRVSLIENAVKGADVSAAKDRERIAQVDAMLAALSAAVNSVVQDHLARLRVLEANVGTLNG